MHCRFRNALVTGGVHDDLLAEVCRQIEGHGLKLKAAEAAIIDATLVQVPRARAPVSTRRRTGPRGIPLTHRTCISAPTRMRARSRRDRKARSATRASQRADEDGYIDRVHTTPANAAESPAFGHMIEGARAQRVMAELAMIGQYQATAAYASRANRDALKGKHRDGIMRKAARGRPLRPSEKRFNRLISKRRLKGRAVLWHHETPFRSRPREILRLGKNPRPAGDGGHRAEPAQSREQDNPHPANPRDRIAPTQEIRLPADKAADHKSRPVYAEMLKTGSRAEVF